MAKKTAKKVAKKKKTVRKKAAGARKKTKTRKKKKVTRKAAPRARKKTAAKKKTAKRKKKVTRKKAAKKKTAKRKKKVTGKKAAKKKATKKKAASRQASMLDRLEKQVDGLAKQLIELTHRLESEVSEQLPKMRDYADKEIELQRRRFEAVVAKVKEENDELTSRLRKFLDEHETLKEVSEGISERAREVEDRVKEMVSKVT